MARTADATAKFRPLTSSELMLLLLLLLLLLVLQPMMPQLFCHCCILQGLLLLG
jgi:hypothetical protein